MKFIFLLLSVLVISFHANSQTKKANTDSTYDIEITLKPLQNDTVLLATYYGSSNSIVDSCVLNSKSVGHFRGKKLVGGIYLIVTKNYVPLFDIIIGDEQHFKIVSDTSRQAPPTIIGSIENDLFKQYNEKRIEFDKAAKALVANYTSAKTHDDSIKIKYEIEAKNSEFKKFRTNFLTKNENSLVVKFLKANTIPETPESYINPATGKVDSTYPFHFIKEHYLDDVDFTDERLLRTPFFIHKIDEYFKNYISPEADSIIPQIKYMLLYAKSNKEMYAYLLLKFTNKYLKPEYMGQDKVFIYLGTDYYLKGDTSFLDAKSKKTIIDKIFYQIQAQLGLAAQPLNLTDTLGKIVSLYNVKSKYTFVAYWSPTCGHCRQEIPVLDSFYKAKWKAAGVTVYSILSEYDLMPELHKIIKEKDLSSDWLYVYESKAAAANVLLSGEIPFRQSYNFIQTPVFYLLDENKKIIAKELSFSQFDRIIENKGKK